jgi:glycosyltransferase involved in cell wall biosynthesis
MNGNHETPMDEYGIIAFAKDWGQDPTSCNHVLRELAKNHRVLWLNSISSRSPNLRHGGDLRRIWQKVTAFCSGPVRVENDLWVYTPIVIPFHRSRLAVAINRLILRATVGRLARRLGMCHTQLWTWVPTSANYLGALGEELLVYYCTDEWSAFTSVDGPATERMVTTLASRADVVFATSTPLVEKLKRHSGQTFLASHGVNYEMFSRALDPGLAAPTDLDGLPRPIVGYYGLIEDWLDLGLIAYLAERHPEWSIVLLGKECVDVSALRGFANVHFLGRKPHDELPSYCKQFAVGLIPHHVNALTKHMNPIKLREYMCAGLPVVSTNLPEVKRYPDWCTVAETHREFEQAVSAAIDEDSVERRRRRSAAMRVETWEAVVGGLAGRVRDALHWRRRAGWPSGSVEPRGQPLPR